jgi:general secretion pathway protein D
VNRTRHVFHRYVQSRKSRVVKDQSLSRRVQFTKHLRAAGLWAACVAFGPLALGQGTPLGNRGGIPAAQPPRTGTPSQPMILPSQPGKSVPTQQPNGVLAVPQSASTSDARLQVYDIPLEHVGDSVLSLQAKFGSDRRVRITTEPNSGRLMVLAPDASQRQIALAVEEIKTRTGSLKTDARGHIVHDSVQSRQYKLQIVTWRELEDAISHIAGSRLTISTINNGEVAQLQMLTETGPREVMTIDRRNDEVRIQGSAKDVMAWTSVVTAIDLAQVDPQRPTQIIPINPATPERIERAIHLVKQASYQQPLQDEATGTIQIPQDQDNTPGAAIGSPDSLTSGTGLIGDVDISFVPELGLVIVKGGKRDVQRVLDVIEQIKKQSQDTQPEIEIYPLRHVNGIVLEPILKDLNDKVFSPRQGQISIYALGQPNSLLLVGRSEALAGIKELITKLDQPIDLNNQLKVFRLVNSSAVDAETVIRNFFGDTTGTTANQNTNANAPGATQLAPRVKVVADYRTNSLIVQASPRDIAEVARLILEIDVESTPAENLIRVFPIKNVPAADLQPLLQAAISGTSVNLGTGNNQGQQQQPQPSTSGPGRSTPPSSGLAVVGPDGNEVSSGILAGVVINSNPSINALIVRAPSKSMPLIEALIAQLDQVSSAEAKMKVYPVVNGDASTLVTILQQAFGLPQTGTNTTNQGFGGGLFGLQNLAALGGGGGGESSLIPLRLSSDPRTNTIIASGGASDLDVIEALLYRLDEAGGNSRTTEVIWLRNANAADVNVALTSLFRDQRTLAQQNLQSQQGFNVQNQQVSLFERADREVLTIFVSPENSTNSIIISATPRYMQQIREVIERLDRQQPMIYVEMLIAEVALTDQFELGTELGLQDSLLFDRNSATGGTLNSPVFNLLNPPFNTGSPQRRPQNVAGQGLSGFAMGRTSELGYGGLVLAASSESFGALFRMLQDANRAQILAKPTLTTIDNNISVVNVGKSVPILGNSTNTVSGVTQSVQYINTGLTMQIQPRTNQDGLINMIVAISRSSVSDADGLTIANGDQLSTTPAFNQTLAQTRVTAYDGQTVILGGLITKERSTVSRRIPWLADIPIAGALFRFDKQSESRTELLVIMTPRVINYNDPDKLEMIKQVESSRMSWCLADVLNLYGDKGLSPGNGLWGPASSPVIYPDETPTVDFAGDPNNCPPGQNGQPMYVEPGFPAQESYPNQTTDNNIIIDGAGQRLPSPIQEPTPLNSSSRIPPRTLLPSEPSSTPGALVQPVNPAPNTYYAPAPNAGRVDRQTYEPTTTSAPRNSVGNNPQGLRLP